MASTNDILHGLYANMSWYQQNSNYYDPMIPNLLMQILAVLRNATKPSNIGFVNGNGYVSDMSPILNYGKINCSTSGKEAYMDSVFSCALFQLPYFLENIKFAYICSIVVIPIMLISVLGKIKESYRWFLLNQAIWDAFMCYSFICEKPSALVWSGAINRKYFTCFYSQTSSNPILETLFVLLRGSFRNAPYIPLFLLAFSRFISLYFPNFYQRNNKTWKIVAFILIFDILIMVTSSFPVLLQSILEYLKLLSFQNCFNTLCGSEFQNNTSQHLQCSKKYEKYFQCENRYETFYQSFNVHYRYTLISITPLMFGFILIFVILLFIKVTFQLKYQLKHNRNAFLQTTKVVAVILFQSLTLTIYLLISAFQTFLQINAVGDYFVDTVVYQSLSPSMFLLQSFATTTSFNIIRIFLDSFIVITALSGYRNGIFQFFAFFFNSFKLPFLSNDSVSSNTIVRSFN